MNTITKEWRDAIRAAAVGVTDTWPPAPFERGNLKTRAHIANCDPQTILALLDALDAAEKEEPVAVKPLEWRGIGPRGSDIEAMSVLGTYTISFDAPTAGGAANLWMAGADVDTFEPFNGTYARKEAKAAAQADYEARIRSALTHPAPAVREGWKLTPYEAQVLIGTTISGCNMRPDRNFDLSAAWAQLRKLGLIDRVDGLAHATDKGASLVAAMLAAALNGEKP